MGIIGWIIFGLIVGVVAKVLTPGRDPGGFIVTIILGILGAVLGGYLGRALGWYQAGDPVGFVAGIRRGRISVAPPVVEPRSPRLRLSRRSQCRNRRILRCI